VAVYLWWHLWIIWSNSILAVIYLSTVCMYVSVCPCLKAKSFIQNCKSIKRWCVGWSTEQSLLTKSDWSVRVDEDERNCWWMSRFSFYLYPLVCHILGCMTTKDKCNSLQAIMDHLCGMTYLLFCGWCLLFFAGDLCRSLWRHAQAQLTWYQFSPVHFIISV